MRAGGRVGETVGLYFLKGFGLGMCGFGWDGRLKPVVSVATSDDVFRTESDDTIACHSESYPFL